MSTGHRYNASIQPSEVQVKKDTLTQAELTRVWSARMPVFVGVFALTLLIGGFGSWSTFSSLAGAVVASGRVEVEQNRQIVQHPDGGVVATIQVREGDRVTVGQVLITLDQASLTSELNIIEGQLHEVMARRARLQAERDASSSLLFDSELLELAPKMKEVADLMAGQTRLFEARSENLQQQRDQLAKQRDQLGEQVRGIMAQTDALELQISLVGEELEAQRNLLARGLAQASRVLALRREEARLLGQIGELRASKAQAESKTTELDIESLKLTSSLREDAITQLRNLRVQELELLERRNSLAERLSRLSIKAPTAGIVYGLAVNTPRSVIRAAEPVLYIVPQDRPLVIAAQVPTIHIDKIFTGQSVNLRFSSLDQRRTPELFGIVASISADSFTNEALGNTYYRAEIALNQGELAKLPDGTVLIPGMPAEAFILTSERSPMDYLVKPLWDYFEQAFRE